MPAGEQQADDNDANGGVDKSSSGPAGSKKQGGLQVLGSHEKQVV